MGFLTHLLPKCHVDLNLRPQDCKFFFIGLNPAGIFYFSETDRTWTFLFQADFSCLLCFNTPNKKYVEELIIQLIRQKEKNKVQHNQCGEERLVYGNKLVSCTRSLHSQGIYMIVDTFNY